MLHRSDEITQEAISFVAELHSQYSKADHIIVVGVFPMSNP